MKGNEVCDDGVNDGSYGHCQSGCTGRAGFCGDGIKNGPEACDNGTNATPYAGTSATGCAPGCKISLFCGDGVATNGEQCDQGAANGSGSCSTACTQQFFYADSFTRDYDGSGCPSGTHVVWIDAGLESYLSASGGSYASVTIQAQTGSSVATLLPAVPITIGTQTGPPVDQTAAWTNFDLFTPLKAVDTGYPTQPLLRLTFTLNPTTDHSATPDLLDWRARFDCAPRSR